MWLVIVTKRLWSAGEKQIGIAKDSIVAAEKSAKAAERSAKVSEDALTILEKPYVFIDRKIDIIPSISSIYNTVSQNATSTPKFKVAFSAVNYGRTPAIIGRLFNGVVLVDGLPDARRIKGTPDIPPSIAIAQNQVEGPFKRTYSEIMTKDICGRIFNNKVCIFLYGQITYYDLFGYEYATGFGWRYIPESDNWEPHGGNEYNFHMTVTPEPVKKAPFRL